MDTHTHTQTYTKSHGCHSADALAASDMGNCSGTNEWIVYYADTLIYLISYFLVFYLLFFLPGVEFYLTYGRISQISVCHVGCYFLLFCCLLLYMAIDDTALAIAISFLCSEIFSAALFRQYCVACRRCHQYQQNIFQQNL